MGYSLLDSYARNWRMRGNAETTLGTYLNSLRQFIRTLDGDERSLLDADRGVLEAYVDRRRVEVSPYSASNDVRAFKSFFAWALEEDEIEIDPAKKLRHPKIEEPPVKVATDDDLERLLKACGRDKIGRRDAAMIALLAYAGIRRGELCVLDFEHLDLVEGTLTIPRTKSGKPRRIPVHSEVLSRLDRYLRLRGEEPGPLFVPYRGERLQPNGVGQMIERRAKSAGVDVRSHVFRRRFATVFLRTGGARFRYRPWPGGATTAPWSLGTPAWTRSPWRPMSTTVCSAECKVLGCRERSFDHF